MPFGRSKKTFESKTPNYGGEGYKRTKTKVVFDKSGNVIKSKSKSTEYAPQSTNGKLTTYAPGKTTVTKRKFDTSGKMTSNKVRPSNMPVRASKKK